MWFVDVVREDMEMVGVTEVDGRQCKMEVDYLTWGLLKETVERKTLPQDQENLHLFSVRLMWLTTVYLFLTIAHCLHNTHSEIPLKKIVLN